MTIEHAKTTAHLPDLFYQQIEENWKYRFENTLNEFQEIFKKWLLKKKPLKLLAINIKTSILK